MLELRTKQRAVLIDKLPDVANIGAGALVFGQVLGDQPFSARLALFGVGMWLLLITFALILARQES
jgi:hypothetical protein